MLRLQLDKAVASSILGYASIAFWLCAQFPQVLKNAKLRSCEGLALPFLMNWLLGDITNLIGCILTDQLPFQTYLAAYFCVVDFSLLLQFFHYRRTKPATSPLTYTYTSVPNAGTLHQSLILPPPPSVFSSPRTRSASNPAGPSIPSLSHPPHTSHTGLSRPRGKRTHTNVITTNGSSSTLDSPAIGPYTDGSYVAIYEAALEVARAAERVERGVIRRSESQRRRLSRQSTHSQSEHEHEDGHDHGDGYGAMTESFHSDMSRNTSSTTEYRIDERMTASTPALNDGRRGRSMRRTLTGIPGLPIPLNEEGDDRPMPLTGHLEESRQRREASRSLSMARGSGGRGGRRAAGVAFMSIGLLVGGRGMLDHPDRTPPPPPPPFDLERFIGRVSAWSCTTLYLTSRLPQIWKNFQRKSVEGLSILLFLFAFCGNLTYVISILLNPAGDADPSEAGHYLLESLPYLLGSGGTLVFDLTIMLQSLIYGSAPPIASTPHTKRMRLPGRSSYRRHRTRTAEDGHGHGSVGGYPHTAHTTGHMGHTGHHAGHFGSGERQPLLTGMSQPVPTTYGHSRDRSISPDVILRITPASVPGKRRRETSASEGVAGNQASHVNQVNLNTPTSPIGQNNQRTPGHG